MLEDRRIKNKRFRTAYSHRNAAAVEPGDIIHILTQHNLRTPETIKPSHETTNIFKNVTYLHHSNSLKPQSS